ncbi:FeS assembly protein SufD [Halodesulfurarchaeum formicicum]|uniref:FeS assembly protein SufD n=1 Tax=Halodesulfurarchaeum formicicum TaxID=1873524 RepID=A0A1D8S494_9EURY|nr:Fe-S cluster assembly protein SufD [Halodesulfurarchaeum formicicum]AOW80176.1 FeS assembly protein SufD [Halodesulfurarchaeum formicicum]APE95475.1 FeS assembly protein SufD [Halodesulfurarchaeum formicicum]
MSSAQFREAVDRETVTALAEQFDEPDWLLETRLEALEAIEELDYPSVIQTPGRKWTNLDDLDFESLVDPLSQPAETSRAGGDEVAVRSITETLQTDPELLEEHYGSVVDPLDNRLVALATALRSGGTVVHVPAGVDAGTVQIETEMNGRSRLEYTLVVAEANSSVTVVDRRSSGDPIDASRYYGGTVEVVAGENATVNYGSLQQFDDDTYAYTKSEGVADTYAAVNWLEGNLGSRLRKSEVGTRLEGDGSETKTVGAFFGRYDQHFDLDSRVWHRGEHTTADLVTRGVVDDRARSVYEGTQDVGREAWDTSSYQRENTLMLSDDSEADASPKLIINNHDTEASHAASVGQVDQRDLFYMTSRGVPEQRARNMLVEGFFVPVLEEMDVEGLREDFEAGVAARLTE